MRVPHKNLLLKLNNLTLYLAGCAMLGTGLMLEWRLPPGSQGGRGLSVLGLGRHDWGEIHFILGLLMTLGIVVHLLLNWSWLKIIASQRRTWRLASGFLLGVIITGLFLLLPVEKRQGGEGSPTNYVRPSSP